MAIARKRTGGHDEEKRSHTLRRNASRGRMLPPGSGSASRMRATLPQVKQKAHAYAMRLYGRYSSGARARSVRLSATWSRFAPYRSVRVRSSHAALPAAVLAQRRVVDVPGNAKRPTRHWPLAGQWPHATGMWKCQEPHHSSHLHTTNSQNVASGSATTMPLNNNNGASRECSTTTEIRNTIEPPSHATDRLQAPRRSSHVFLISTEGLA